jgi:hypothetical protein
MTHELVERYVKDGTVEKLTKTEWDLLHPTRQWETYYDLIVLVETLLENNAKLVNELGG